MQITISEEIKIFTWEAKIRYIQKEHKINYNINLKIFQLVEY